MTSSITQNPALLQRQGASTASKWTPEQRKEWEAEHKKEDGQVKAPGQAAASTGQASVATTAYTPSNQLNTPIGTSSIPNPFQAGNVMGVANPFVGTSAPNTAASGSSGMFPPQNTVSMFSALGSGISA